MKKFNTGIKYCQLLLEIFTTLLKLCFLEHYFTVHIFKCPQMILNVLLKEQALFTKCILIKTVLNLHQLGNGCAY